MSSVEHFANIVTSTNIGGLTFKLQTLNSDMGHVLPHLKPHLFSFSLVAISFRSGEVDSQHSCYDCH